MLGSYDAKQCSFRNHKADSITGVEKKNEEGGTETESSSASEANKNAKNAGKAQVIGDAEYSKMMDGLLNQN